MSGQDQAAHHAEQLQIQHELERVIVKATLQPITQDEQALLAWASSTKLFNQENCNEQIKSNG